MKTKQKQDNLEACGFKYNEDTFDEIFVKKFNDTLNVSTESSADERDYGEFDHIED